MPPYPKLRRVKTVQCLILRELLKMVLSFAIFSPIPGGVSEHPNPGMMQFCITLDISTTTSARTLKLGQDMH